MEARLRPLSVAGEQECHAYSIGVDPDVTVFTYEQPGQMGTVNHFVVRGDPHSSLSIHAESTVDTLCSRPFVGLDLLAQDWDGLSNGDVAKNCAEFLSPTPLVPFIGFWSGPDTATSVLAYAQALSAEIYGQFEYVPGATEISTPLTEFVSLKRGVCQDYAHLMLSVARAHGVPARYVSGYIYAGDDTGTHGAGATHAWVELYLPHAQRWKGFDPTNNILVGDRHVKIAVGRDYADVPPTKGILRAKPGLSLPSATSLTVDVRIERVGA